MLANGHTNENKNNKEEEKEKEDVPVYNYVSSPQKPITWSKYRITSFSRFIKFFFENF